MRKLRIALGLGLVALGLIACVESVTLGATTAVLSVLAGLGILTPMRPKPAPPTRPMVHPCLSMVNPAILERRHRQPPPRTIEPNRMPTTDGRICLSEFVPEPSHTSAPDAPPAIDKAAIKDKLIALGALPPDVIDRLR